MQLSWNSSFDIDLTRSTYSDFTSFAFLKKKLDQVVPFDEYVKAATITIRHGVFQLISLFWTLLLKYLLAQQIAFVITLKRFEVNLQAHYEMCKDHLNDDNRIELVSWSH